MRGAREPQASGRLFSRRFAAIVATASVLGGCGAAGTSRSRTTTTRRPTRPATASTNYNAQGVWLGEAEPGTPWRVCGYLTTGRYTLWNVQTHRMTCADVTRLIDTYLAHDRHARAGWQAKFRHDTPPPGGPPGSNDVRGFLLVVSTNRVAGVYAGLSEGRRTAPPPITVGAGPVEVHFGCPTRSSICH